MPELSQISAHWEEDPQQDVYIGSVELRCVGWVMIPRQNLHKLRWEIRKKDFRHPSIQVLNTSDCVIVLLYEEKALRTLYKVLTNALEL